MRVTSFLVVFAVVFLAMVQRPVLARRGPRGGSVSARSSAKTVTETSGLQESRRLGKKGESKAKKGEEDAADLETILEDVMPGGLDGEIGTAVDAVRKFFSELVVSGLGGMNLNPDLDKFFEVAEDIMEWVSERNDDSASLVDLMDVVEGSGDIYQNGPFGVVAPTWSIKKFPDGENRYNEGTSQNKYAWAGDFNKQCGMGVMIHSAGTAGYLNLSPTNATMTFRDADAEIVMKWEMDIPLLGIRSALVTGCTDSTVEVLIATVGYIYEGETITPLSLYKVIVDLEDESVALVPLVGDLSPFVQASSIRAMIQGFDGNDCHVAFSPLMETGFPVEPYPIMWTMDICAVEVADTLTQSTLYREGLSEASLVNHIIWDFVCENGSSVDDVCWYNLVTIALNSEKAAGFDLVPVLVYSTKGDLAPPSSPSVASSVQSVDTQGFLDASSFALEPIDSNEVMVCTLSSYVYQAVFGSTLDFIDFDDPDSMTTKFELGAGQECHVCSTMTNDCSPVLAPGIVSSTVYIWQVERCGDNVFFGTFDGTSFMSGALLSIVLNALEEEFEISFFELGLPENVEFGFLQAAGTFLLTLLLRDLVTMWDYGFDLWYIPVDNIGSMDEYFKPLTLDGFRGLQDYDAGGGTCHDNYWMDYDPLEQVDDGVRKLVCHSKVDGSDPKLVVGGATFNSDKFSSTYVVSMDERCIS